MFAGRTDQDILAERRANVLEAMRERDAMARAMLLHHVATIDAELARRHPALVCAPAESDCPRCDGHSYDAPFSICPCVAPEVPS